MSRRFVESFFPSSTHYLATSSSSVVAHAYTSLFVPWWVIAIANENEGDDVAVDAFCSSEVTLSIPATPWNTTAWSTNTTDAASNSSSSSMVTIRNPALCIWAIWGALYGCRCSLSLCRQWRRHRNGSVVATSETYAPRRQQSLLLWSWAFAGYGIMNAVAIPLHCFLPVQDGDGTIVLPLQYPVLWTLDTFWTGAFSTALVFAVGQEYLESFFSNKAAGQWRLFVHTWAMLWACLLVTVGLGGYCVWSVWSQTFLTSSTMKDKEHSETVLTTTTTLPLELWYLLPLLVAIVVVAMSFKSAPLRGPSYHDGPAISPAWMGAVALVVAILGLLADATACRVATRLVATAGAAAWQAHGSRRPWWQFLLLDTLRAPAVAFGACNGAFVSLYQRATLRLRPELRFATNRTKHD
jgi:hypothetical protein